MGVGAEGEARIVVTEDGGDCFDVHAVLESQGGESVPFVKNREKTLENTKLYWQSLLKKGNSTNKIRRFNGHVRLMLLELHESHLRKLNDPTWYASLRGVSGSVNVIIREYTQKCNYNISLPCLSSFLRPAPDLIIKSDC